MIEMEWIKLYTNIIDDVKIGLLDKDFGRKNLGLGIFIKFLCIYAKQTNYARKTFEMDAARFQQLLSINSVGFEKVLNRFSLSFEMSVKTFEGVLKIDYPKFSELMGKDKKYNRKRIVNNDPRVEERRGEEKGAVPPFTTPSVEEQIAQWEKEDEEILKALENEE